MFAWAANLYKTIVAAIGVKRFAIGGLVTAVPSLVEIMGESLGMSWVHSFSTWVLTLFVVMAFVMVCFLLYANKLRIAAEPRLTIEYDQAPPYVITDRPETVGPVERTIRIKIQNIGGDLLDNCLVKLDNIHGNCDGIQNVTPVGFITQHQQSQKRPGGVFNLRPQEFKFIEVASLNERSDTSAVRFHFESESIANRFQRGEYELKIGAYGGPAPVFKKFKIFIDGGKLRMVQTNA